MNKILMIFLMIVPITAFAEVDLDMQSQMLDSQIERLTSERDSKYEALQKCEKKTKGFKIAGLTTLVATGFGIYGNIKLSEKIKGKGSRRRGRGGGSLNLAPRTVAQAIDEDCLEDCPQNDSEQCKVYMACWATDPSGASCQC